MRRNYYHNMGTKDQNWLLIGWLTSPIWLSLVGVLLLLFK